MTRGARFLAAPAPRYSRALVGASIWQTPGGIQSELSKVNAEIEAFGAELEGQVASRGEHVYTHADAMDMLSKAAQGVAPASVKLSHDPIVRFYDDVWLPFVTGWRAWYHDHNGWFHNLWWNEAPNAEAYQEKLVGLRAQAQKLGMAVRTPAPDIEPMSIADPHRRSPIDPAFDAAAELAKIAKYALYGGIAIGGAWGITQVVQSARGKRK